MTTIRREAPVYYVRAVPDGAGGPALRVDLADRVLSFKYDDEERRADKLTLTLDNWDITLYDDPAFKKGMMLEVQWGYPGNMVPARTMVVTKISGGLTVTVTAQAKSLLLNTITRSRRFEASRRSDVIRQLAKEAGYEDAAVDIDETSQVFPSIQQARLTDAQFIKRLANLEGFEFYVDHSGFHWHARRVSQRPSRVLEYFTDLQGEVLDFNIENDITARPKPGRTRHRGRNPLERTDINALADDESESDRGVLGSILDIGSPPAENTTQQQTTTHIRHVDAETQQQRIEVMAAGEESVPTSAANETQAQNEARARFKKVQQTAVKLTLDIIGDPGLLAKIVVEVQGLGHRISGKYYVKKVATSIDSGGGYKQSLECISDGHGGHATSSALADGLELVNPGPQTAARVNHQEPAPGAESATPGAEEPAERVQVRVRDAETQQTRIEYRSSRGQQQGSS